jgi:hypothetical protein
MSFIPVPKIVSYATSKIASRTYAYFFVQKEDRSLINKVSSPLITWCLENPHYVATMWWVLKFAKVVIL